MKHLLTFFLLTMFSFAAFSQASTTLDGSASFDADGTIAAWQWIQIAGPNSSTLATPNAMKTTATNLIAGVYRYELTVTDNQGAIDKDTVSVTVKAANSAPKANAGPDQIIQIPGSALAVPVIPATKLNTIAKKDRELYEKTEALSLAEFPEALKRQEYLFDEIISFYERDAFRK